MSPRGYTGAEMAWAVAMGVCVGGVLVAIGAYLLVEGLTL